MKGLNELEFAPERALGSIVIGAPLGGLLTGLLFISFAAFDAHEKSAPAVTWIATFLFAAYVATIVFFLGLATIGAVGWFLLRRAGFKGWLPLSLFGATTVAIANFSTFAGVWDRYGLPGRLIFSGPMGFVGGLVGAAIWRIAHRRIDAPEHS